MTDAQQFEAFLHNYQNMVFSTAMRLTANPSEAEDITQEVFLRAYERFGELQGSPTVAGWLKTVARNLSLNHLSRYRSRWSFFSEMVRDQEADDEPTVDFPAPDDTHANLAAGDRREFVEKALQSLPASQRVPLVLHHFEDLQYDEIAEKLGVSLGKVKTDIFRGREALRRKLRLKLNEEESGQPCERV
ncbi:MAG TPA: RNA polymerase sigma factor [Verrucomicrobiae bacterium]|nr:RNA polymerase sigma factor [Verrucomicrobiae bacterium]